MFLNDAVITEVGRIFRALGDEPRLRLLRALMEASQPLSQKALADAAGLTQANASKHLICLASAGLVTREPQGNTVLFSPVAPLVTGVCALVRDHVTRRITSSYEAMH